MDAGAMPHMSMPAQTVMPGVFCVRLVALKLVFFGMAEMIPRAGGSVCKGRTR